MSGMLPLLIIFFLSGATALTYEVLWTRQLSLVFGVTTYAVSAVLATYMGGLALGSFLMGRLADRLRSPLMGYAVLELAIGVYALLVPWLFTGLRPLYIEVARLGLSYPMFAAIRVALAIAVLLVPTTLMGGTYPLLMRHWTRHRKDLATGAGILYFVNTGGAIVGCAMAGYYLLEHHGLRGANLIAAATNVALAACSAFLALRTSDAPAASLTSTSASGRDALSAAQARLVLLVVGLSGFISLAAQVLWTRALLRYVYNSTYAFSSILGVFLLGIAIGSAAFTAVLSRLGRPLLSLAALQASAGLGLLVALAVFPQLPLMSQWAYGTHTIASFEQSVLIMALCAVVVLLPFVVFLGAIFPLATYLYAEGRDDVGTATGHVYAANTFGAILGSLGGAFLLIPTLGMWGTHRLLVALCMLAAAGTAVAATSEPRGRQAMFGMVAIGLCLTVLVGRENVFRSTFAQAAPGATIAFYEEGMTDTAVVLEQDGQRTIMYDDFRGTASTWTYGYNFFFGHLPMLIHPGTPRKALHICFGVGNSLSAVAAHDELERVDNVELSPHILHSAPYFWTNDGVLEHPKVRTIIDDGRNYLMTTSEQYDVILLEPPEPFTAGVINLYTVEFYRDALERLNSDGIIMQWIPTANAPLETERDLFRAFHDVFPHSTMWWQLSGGCALLIGSRQPLAIDYQKLKRRFQEPRVRQDLNLAQLRDVDDFLSNFVFDEATFAAFVKDATATTDDNTVLDFTMPRYAGSGFGRGQFAMNVNDNGQTPGTLVNARRQEYLAMRKSPVPYLTNLGDESADVVAARIETASKRLMVPPPLSRQEWERMRKNANLPSPALAAGGGP